MKRFPLLPSDLTIGRRLFIAGAASSALLPAAVSAQSKPTMMHRPRVDADGVWRRSDGREVALFGVNYCLASASAFRFAKASGRPFDEIIDQDFTHFRRLGFNAIRLSFWGDWENTTNAGALIENEHLFVLDRIVARAHKDGIGCLLSPIVTYASSWPDLGEKPKEGIAAAFEKSALGTDPQAIAAQVRYLHELLSRTNPVTGTRYADEPAIVAVEPINEPWHHSDDQAGSVRYINALADAVRGTGYDGPVFHNVTQDMKMAPAIGEARVDGATFAWYPTGLQQDREIEGNGLLLVDRYDQFADPSLRRRAKLVYEFDAADSLASYYYPAMTRTFRTGGAQFATVFTYDPLPIAAANSEFNDHYLNLAYTPAKALSAKIAAMAMSEVPRGKDYGFYPESMHFGNFIVDDAADLSVFADETRFYHSNDTTVAPPAPNRLTNIAGVGSSPIASYDGAGAWFLDRTEPGVWRLEVYPDAATTKDPFNFRRPTRAATRIVARTRRMTLRLPDLGAKFEVAPVAGSAATIARQGSFAVTPGVYRLAAKATRRGVDPTFHAPAGETFEPILLHRPPASRTAGVPWHLALDVISPIAPAAVTLWIRGANGVTPLPFQAGPRFRYSVTIPSNMLVVGDLEYYVVVDSAGVKRVWPDSDNTLPTDWDFPRSGGFQVPIAVAGSPLLLLDAGRHSDQVVIPYKGENVPQAFGSSLDASGRRAWRIDPIDLDKAAGNELPLQRSWSGSIDDEGRVLGTFSVLKVSGSSTGGAATIWVILIERDGMAWGAAVTLHPDGRDAVLPMTALRPVEAAMLPRDYPVGVNPLKLRRPAKRGGPGDRPQLRNLQAVQVTLAKSFLGQPANPTGVAHIAQVALTT